MPGLVPALFDTASADLILVATFAYLYRQDRARPLALWAAGFGAAAARHTFALLIVVFGRSLPLVAAVEIATPVSLLLILAGTYAFVGHRMSRLWIYGGIVVGAWAVGCEVVGSRLLVTRLPSFWFLGAVTVWTGVVFIRRLRRTPGSIVTGTSFILLGLHLMDHPFLRSVASFAPWGFSLATLFELAAAIGILVLYFERARGDLARSEQRFRSLFEGALEGVFRAGPDGALTEANPALAGLLGHADPKTLIGTRLADLCVDPDAWPSIEARLAAGEAIEAEEVSLRKQDGTEVSVSLHARRTPDGPDAGFVHDVTEARRLEAQLRQAQKMEALGRIAGGVAHDFNNLLTVILGSTDLLQTHLADPRAKELAEGIDDAAGRAAALTRQLLAFSRRQVLRPEVLDLRRHVEGLATLLRRLIGEDVSLTVETGGEPGSEAGLVRADPVQLEQVILNLAINARDAMPDGGSLTIRVGRQVPYAEAVRHPDGTTPKSFVLLEVVDTGEGMDQDTLAHLFEPFYTTKARGRGTGLGLATVYGIVTQSGGHIEVDSALGAGSTFRVFFPVATRGGAETERSPAPPPRAGSETVLVVEDEPSLRALVERILVEQGYKVVLAEDGDRAVEGFGDGAEVDLLVTDVVMPGKSGPQVAEALRAHRPDLPVVLMSGYADRHVDAASAVGGVFLAKPFTAPALLEAVRSALDGTRARSTGAVAS